MKIDYLFGKDSSDTQENELFYGEYSENFEIREDDYQLNSEFFFDKRLVALY